MKIILLIMIGLSGFLNADFTKVGDIVSDSTTGLEWQDNNETNSSVYNWQEAIDYCEALSLDTHDDWRLPNVNELKSIVDRSKNDPAIVDEFEYVKYQSFFEFYWSSTSMVGVENAAWVVLFDNGYVYGYLKDDNFYIRCVRDGQ